MITVLMSGLFGACSALTFRMSEYTKYIKMYSAGVIASLALVHISSEVITELAIHIHYRLGATCILSGMLLMAITEHMSHSWTDNDVPSDIETPLTDDNFCQSQDCTIVDCDSNKLENNDIHTHSCITNLNSKSLANAAMDNKKKLVVYIFEFACVFHSLLIGFSVGLTTGSSNLRTLTIALCFHQFLEGISLGFVISDACLSFIKKMFLVVSYSVTTPIGIVIGLTIESVYADADASASVHQQTRAIVQGCIQGVAAGILTYVAMIQLIAEEFSKEDMHGKGKWFQRCCMYASLLSGAASMCALALWL